MQAKKSLGQNFLRSKAALGAIIAASDPTPDDIVLEIGPGEGVLTAELLKFAGKVVAVEKDHRLIPILKEKFSEEVKKGKLDVVEADVLGLAEDFFSRFADFSSKNIEKKSSASPRKYKIVANIPYYITGQVLRQFLESENQPESMTLLLQKEVAERIIAKDQKESLLSISVKVFGTPKYVKTVPRGAFYPMPKVDSAIIHIENVNKERFKEGKVEEKKFFEVLKKGFGHKRKLLIKNLGATKEVFEKCGIPEKARAEDLEVHDWLCLTKELI